MTDYPLTSPRPMPGPPQAPAGWYPDPAGSGGQRYWDGWAWQAQAAPAWPAFAGASPAPALPVNEYAADSLARGVATYQRVSGVLWIVLGVVQILSVVLIVAGLWNVFAGITRLSSAGSIERREAGVPAAFEGVVGLALIGIVNLVFGAVLGVVLVAVDVYVRQRILDNRHIFTR